MSLARAERARSTLMAVLNNGNKVVLCSCSTFGSCMEAVRPNTNGDIICIDRPLAEQAKALGIRIVVAATLHRSITPTKSLLSDEARKANRGIEVIDWLCKLAWAKFEAGDQQGYLEETAVSFPQAAS